jgi:hypothetical protein
VLHADDLEATVRQVEDGKLSLDELDQIAEQGATVSAGLALVLGTGNPAQIALSFLTSDEHDTKLVKKGTLQDLAKLLATSYDAVLGPAVSPAQMRKAFGRYLLQAELLNALGDQVPASLEKLLRPGRKAALENCLELVVNWRNRRDLRTSYVDCARTLESDLGLRTIALPADAIERLETFEGLEIMLQEGVERALLEAPEERWVRLAQAHQDSFWSSASQQILDRWALLVSIGRLLVAAKSLQAELKDVAPDPDAVAGRYLGSERTQKEPWCLLDTYHRHMERRFHQFDVDVNGAHAGLEKLVHLARTRYTHAAGMLAGRFLDALSARRFKVASIPRQREIFERFVRPALEQGKTAYILVDGLRYEMARELHLSLKDTHEAMLEGTLGTLPSITEIGMAALLPGAEKEVELVAAGSGKLALKIGGQVLKNRQERLDFLTAAVTGKVQLGQLGKILPPSAKMKEGIRDADLIVLTATEEIDGLCEKDNIEMARRLLDDVLVQLRRGAKVLFDLGVQTVIVTSDHGHLFGEELDSGSKIDPPGGQTADLHRRVWVGKGGKASESYLRVSAGEVGLQGDLELALPRALGAFKAGGANAYFHGGASPQELLVPVLVARQGQGAAGPPAQVQWTLTLGGKKISTRFLSVQIQGAAASALFELASPVVRVEVREGKQTLSKPISASYGFEDATGFVRLESAPDGAGIRPCSVTLMLEGTPKGKSVNIALVDAATEKVLKTLEKVEVSLAGF